jgi:hypothetical protein
MKPITITLLLFSLISCGQKSELSQKENDLLKKVNFETNLISELRNLTDGEFKQLPAIDEETGEVLTGKFFNGIYSQTTENKANGIVKELKRKFRASGYLIFVFETDDNKKNIAVIKGKDDLDILRYRRTDGINNDLENKDIVNKILEWKTKYGLTVIGCSRDWLEVEFDKLPADMDAFAKEVYEFCPDSVDQGVGSIENLKATISEMNGVWLWWD